MLEITGHIAQLEAKKHTASVAESRFAKVIDQLKRMKTLTGSDGQTEESSSFLHLLIDTISLDEYSSHFLTLTIVWAAPFGQVDVCFIYRPSGGHQRWSTQDEIDLKRLYPHSDRLAVVERFPTRSWGSIYTWACKLGLSRYTDVNTSGFTNRDISLADWRLLQEHGWILPEKGYGRYWLYDVKNDVIDSLSSPG